MQLDANFALAAISVMGGVIILLTRHYIERNKTLDKEITNYEARMGESQSLLLEGHAPDADVSRP